MVSHVLKFKWYAFFSEVTRKIGYCHFSAVNLSGLEMIQNQCYLLSVTWFLLHALQECSESVSESFSVEMLLWKQEPLVIICTSDFVWAFPVVTHLTSICGALGADDRVLLTYLGLRGDWLDGTLTAMSICWTSSVQALPFLSCPTGFFIWSVQDSTVL